MILLITDTSGKSGSVALARADENSASGNIEIVQETPLSGGTFSAQLVPQIAQLLSKHGFSKTDIAAFIVAAGPGSFTGLRVGLAAIKALAEILDKPIVPVSLLEALALAAPAEESVVAALDAGRGDAYVGEYVVASSPRLIEEKLLPKQDVISFAGKRPVSTTDPHLADLARQAGLRVHTLNSIDAAMLAHIGWQKLQRRETVTPLQLDANYIRRTDAEIFSNPPNRVLSR